MPDPHILSVTDLTRRVREVVEGSVGEVWVEGEISNYRKQASGHQYFTLKDDRCQLACVLFYRPGLKHAAPPLSEGMLVHVRGMLTVYEARGQYQLNVAQVRVAGAGLLQAKMEALKRKLAAEGLFDTARKRPLPPFPKTIGVVTSPTGAAIRDMLNILQRRAPWVRILIHPVRVQGVGAAAEIAAAVADFNSGTLPPVDVVVVARGGGSAEDLWEFNEESVVRAIAASAVPVISAVGHEIDFTLADFAADLRAPTPSAAAELVVPDAAELARRLDYRRTQLERLARGALAGEKARLALAKRSTLFRDPQTQLDAASQRLDAATENLSRAVAERISVQKQRVFSRQTQLREHRPDHWLALRRQQLQTLAARLPQAAHHRLQTQQKRLEHTENLLRVMAPQATLARGYSITRLADGRLLRSARQATPGSPLVTQLADGVVHSRTDLPG